MRRPSPWIGWLCLVLVGFGTTRAGGEEPAATTIKVPIDDLPAAFRDRVRAVLEHPTIVTRAQADTFACKPAQYYEFLDHPDRAVAAWRKLGAKCVSIADRGKGQFGWTDDRGGDVHWDLILSDPKMRVWYAEGQARPKPLLPMVHFEAVVILHITEGRDAAGKTTIRHQAELAAHSDSKAAALVARLLGPSAPRAAEQYVQQLQMFFSALSWYCYQHPEEMEKAGK
jgi:hypothetical protein